MWLRVVKLLNTITAYLMSHGARFALAGSGVPYVLDHRTIFRCGDNSTQIDFVVLSDRSARLSIPNSGYITIPGLLIENISNIHCTAGIVKCSNNKINLVIIDHVRVFRFGLIVNDDCSQISDIRTLNDCNDIVPSKNILPPLELAELRPECQAIGVVVNVGVDSHKNIAGIINLSMDRCGFSELRDCTGSGNPIFARLVGGIVGASTVRVTHLVHLINNDYNCFEMNALDVINSRNPKKCPLPHRCSIIHADKPLVDFKSISSANNKSIYLAMDQSADTLDMHIFRASNDGYCSSASKLEPTPSYGGIFQQEGGISEVVRVDHSPAFEFLILTTDRSHNLVKVRSTISYSRNTGEVLESGYELYNIPNSTNAIDCFNAGFTVEQILLANSNTYCAPQPQHLSSANSQRSAQSSTIKHTSTQKSQTIVRTSAPENISTFIYSSSMGAIDNPNAYTSNTDTVLDSAYASNYYSRSVRDAPNTMSPLIKNDSTTIVESFLIRSSYSGLIGTIGIVGFVLLGLLLVGITLYLGITKFRQFRAANTVAPAEQIDLVDNFAESHTVRCNDSIYPLDYQESLRDSPSHLINNSSAKRSICSHHEISDV